MVVHWYRLESVVTNQGISIHIGYEQSHVSSSLLLDLSINKNLLVKEEHEYIPATWWCTSV